MVFIEELEQSSAGELAWLCDMDDSILPLSEELNESHECGPTTQVTAFCQHPPQQKLTILQDGDATDD